MTNKEAIKFATKITMWLALPIIWLGIPIFLGMHSGPIAFWGGLLISTFITCFILAKFVDASTIKALGGKE